jgi:hypothetical protein
LTWESEDNEKHHGDFEGHDLTEDVVETTANNKKSAVLYRGKERRREEYEA